MPVASDADMCTPSGRQQQGDRPGFDPFDGEGAFVLEAAEAAIRRGERW
jgi:hypothetical protein